jgi:hypothetical protein
LLTHTQTYKNKQRTNRLAEVAADPPGSKYDVNTQALKLVHNLVPVARENGLVSGERERTEEEKLIDENRVEGCDREKCAYPSRIMT